MSAALRLLPLLLAVGLSGCGTLGSRLAGDSANLLAYHAHVRGLSAAEWAKENDQSRPGKDDGDLPRLRQAVLLAAPSATPRDHARALQLFEQLEREHRSDSQLQNLIGALRAELAERRRLEEKNRDEARRADDAEQKLDALKAIEKNLMEREQRPRRP
jgi:hypothetical protein